MAPIRRRHLHPANQVRHDERIFAQRAADATSGFLGSWRYIGLQTLVIIVWVLLNVTAWVRHWDPYTFTLLNLIFSIQAAYASPLILLAQNRQAEHDRDVAEHDFAVNQEALALLKQLVAGQHAIKQQQAETAGELPPRPPNRRGRR
jgi:uncharacterized membrane protein